MREAAGLSHPRASRTASAERRGWRKLASGTIPTPSMKIEGATSSPSTGKGGSANRPHAPNRRRRLPSWARRCCRSAAIPSMTAPSTSPSNLQPTVIDILKEVDFHAEELRPEDFVTMGLQRRHAHRGPAAPPAGHRSAAADVVGQTVKLLKQHHMVETPTFVIFDVCWAILVCGGGCRAAASMPTARYRDRQRLRRASTAMNRIFRRRCRRSQEHSVRLPGCNRPTGPKDLRRSRPLLRHRVASSASATLPDVSIAIPPLAVLRK